MFKKLGKVTTANVKALGRYLRGVRGWIRIEAADPQRPVVDEDAEWLRLFSGQDNACEFVFTGQDLLDVNHPRTVGVANLYCLFRRLADEKLIEGNVGPILERHFTDTKGRYLTRINKNAKASDFAEPIIKKALTYMQTQMTEEMIADMQMNDLLDEEMNREGERGKTRAHQKDNY